MSRSFQPDENLARSPSLDVADCSSRSCIVVPHSLRPYQLKCVTTISVGPQDNKAPIGKQWSGSACASQSKGAHFYFLV
ncbi:hypothetical protein Y032_0012g1801 [Ancylostoma ceylanicum]|uniref:Uncharacterized protein n=1 Tax=Ancylostoma ceylanicum TaxID=53326 RepID=A0A016VEV5_9BILA|nr:hypothetical protein Y032_0012g1801 [Ancylostoma ceylanicum]